MKRILKILGFLVGAVILIVGVLIFYGGYKLNQELQVVRNHPSLGVAVDTSSLKMGERIVTIRNGCIHCHGGDLGGLTFIDDPVMGLFAGSNLTPAKLKDWTDEEIARAIRYGLNRDNKSLLFMPAGEFQYLSKTDIAAIISYLRAVPPVEKESSKVSVGPMAKILFAMGKLPMLVAGGELIDPALDVKKPEEGNTVEFGKYIVNSACIGCHRSNLEGGPVPGWPPDWPPATALNSLKSRGYTVENFFKVLRLGVRPDGTNLKPPMVSSTTRLMTDDELGAIWKYLESMSK